MRNTDVFCITGIDTDIGKTIATGLLGRYLRQKGLFVITQKIVQTGCSGMSDDIVRHRQLMGMDLQDVDHSGLTCPYLFPEACSPHLAASLAGREIDCTVITEATAALCREFDTVLLEGVGGLLVPLNTELTLLDYLEQRGYPLILVSSPRLGSINHTLASLELAKVRGLQVLGILYNRFIESDQRIAEDSARVFARYLRRYGYNDCVIDFSGEREYGVRQLPAFNQLFQKELSQQHREDDATGKKNVSEL
jgi:dethiobiotin synthetase